MSPPEERNRSPEARPPERSRERLKDRREAAEPEELRRELAAAVFEHTASYDAAIT